MIVIILVYTEFERLKYLNIPQKDRDELNLEIKKFKI